jgi:hypothetical protein
MPGSPPMVLWQRPEEATPEHSGRKQEELGSMSSVESKQKDVSRG